MFNHTPRTPNQTDDAIHHWNSTTPPPAHTHNRAHTTQCTKRGRQTHPRNKSTLAHYRVLKQHQHTQTNPHNSEPASSDFGIRQRLFSCPPHKPERISLSSGALSVSLTRYKLHTPHAQHKPAAQRGFLHTLKCLLWVHIATQERGVHANTDQQQQPSDKQAVHGLPVHK